MAVKSKLGGGRGVTSDHCQDTDFAGFGQDVPRLVVEGVVIVWHVGQQLSTSQDGVLRALGLLLLLNSY